MSDFILREAYDVKRGEKIYYCDHLDFLSGEHDQYYKEFCKRLAYEMAQHEIRNDMKNYTCFFEECAAGQITIRGHYLEWNVHNPVWTARLSTNEFEREHERLTNANDEEGLKKICEISRSFMEICLCSRR